MTNDDDDFFDFEEDKEFDELIHKFEQYVHKGEYCFFDSQEILEIIDYYSSWMDKDMTAKAIEIGLQNFPQSPEILLKKAEFLAKQNYTLEALKILNEIESQLSHYPDFFLIKGDIYAQMGLSEQAINEYKKILETDYPNKDHIFNIIGSEYLMQDKFYEAIVYFKKSVEWNADNNPSLYKIYFCYSEIDKLNECIEYFQKVIDESPFNSDAWLYLAFSYYDIEDYENALESINFALAINPSDLLIILKKSDILKELDRYDEAIEVLKEALEKDNQNSFLMNILAETYNETGLYDTAIQYFHKALHLNPKDSRSWLGLAESYTHISHNNEAINCLHQAIKYSNDDPLTLLEAGKLYITLEYYEEAINTLKLVLEKEYEPNEVYVWLCIALEKAGYVTEAVDILADQIYNQHNDDADLLYCLAGILLLYQYRKEGLATLEKALQSDPTGIDILFEFNSSFEDDPEIQNLIQQYNNN
ncbi:MAG: tetratricopeptide repeat protein [Bacteroidia bacterium]|nr:tetratricopeptide repeat protein [Bacteroidia bacterium]